MTMKRAALKASRRVPSKKQNKSVAVPPERRLLVSLEHAVPLKVWYHLSKYTRHPGADALEPLAVTLPGSTQVALRLTFDLVTKTGVHYGEAYNSSSSSDDGYDDNVEVVVSVRDVAPPSGVELQIEASLETFARTTGHKSSAFIGETDRSTWNAPVRVSVKLTGAGVVGRVTLATLRHLTVRLHVYAVGEEASRAVLGGFQSMLASSALCDVVLKVGPVDFPAHKVVLAASSPVFLQMFSSDFRESKEGVVEVAGTSAAAFSVFLEFLYSAAVVDWKGCEVEVLKLADMYLVDSLKAVCVEQLLRMQMPPDTALELLKLDSNPLVVRVRAMEAVMGHWAALADTPLWIQFEADYPVAADYLRVAQGMHSKK